MKKIITAIFLSTILANCQDNHKVVERDGEPDVVYFENTDAEMNLAVKNAKRSLPEFEKALESKNPNFSNFALKQRFDTADGNGEHIWIGEIELRNGKYFGIVQNDPVDVKDLHLGYSVEVVNDWISDWMYYDKNIVKGAFTVRVMRANMSEEELKEMDSEGIIYE